MFSFLNSSKTEKEEQNIELLISRLQHSEYLDDKYDAIKEIELCSNKNILETGSLCIYPIIYSMNELLDISVNLKILNNIFTCTYAPEFIDLLLKDKDLINIMLDNSSKDSESLFKLILELSNNDKFNFVFVEVNKAPLYVVNLVKKGDIKLISKLIKKNENFDKEIVFEGIFEVLISLESFSTSHIQFLDSFLENNHFNQNYFIETDWHRININVKHIVCVLIDNTNSNIDYIKDVVYNKYDFNRALKDANYQFIYNMISGSRKYRLIFLEIFYKEDLLLVLPKIKVIESNENDQIIAESITAEHINEKEELYCNNQDISSHLQTNITDKTINNAEGSNNNETKNELNNLEQSLDTKNNLQKPADIFYDDYIVINGTQFCLYTILYYFLNKEILRFSVNRFVCLIYFEILKEKMPFLDNNCIYNKYSLVCKDAIYYNEYLSNLLLIFSIRSIDYRSDISQLPLNFNTILFFIIVADKKVIQSKLDLIKQQIMLEKKDSVFRRLCIILCCIHGINVKFNKAYLLDNCKVVRKYIVNAEDNSLFVNDEVANIMLDKINELCCLYITDG